LTSFIGRHQEIEQIAHQLRKHRLLTLTGTGGIGKTRLAIEAGWQLAADYVDGVWMVDLAVLQDPMLVPATISTVLGLNSSLAGGLHAVAAELSEKHLLLILDNCEHVIGEAAHCAEALLRACPRLRILATSRERLAINGENVVRVSPLPLPLETKAPASESAWESEAVRLFVERAQGLGEELAPTDETAIEIAAICRRLDGLPLAIEMAVPRLRVLSLSQLASDLDEHFGLLIEGNRTASPRHRSLQAILDWSYALMTNAERKLLQQLSIFAGNVDLETVLAIAADPGVARMETIDVLTALIDKSLVATDRESGIVKYRLLETTRDYAREKLPAENGRALRCRHTGFFLARLAQAALEWETMPGQLWLDRYGSDLGEIRSALQWAFDPQGDETLAISLTANSHVLWSELGLTTEHRRWVKEALSRLNDQTSFVTVAHLLSWQAGDVRDIDDPSDYSDALRAAALHAQLGNNFAEGKALLRAGMARPSGDDDREGAALLNKAHELLVPFGPTKTLAWCLSAIASERLQSGDLAKARQLHEEALAIFHQIDASALRPSSH
jgi:predicted ATPase